MRGHNFFSWSICVAAMATVFMASACSINVQKDKNGQDKHVDIKTLLGGVHVSNQADASDTGLAVYPGARVKEKSDDDKGANVNLSGFGYGIRVVALEYESADAPAKVLAFYQDQLKRYGTVLECRTTGLHLDMKTDSHGSNDLTCEGASGKDVELKVGKKNDQHIVAIQPDGSGSSFSLVYVQTHGKDADI
jgi:hypothetical protein